MKALYNVNAHTRFKRTCYLKRDCLPCVLHTYAVSICRLVEFVKSEANPKNNLMMRRAGLSKHWCNVKSLLELLQCLQSDVQFSIDVCKYMLTTFIVLIINVNLKTETVNNPPAFPHNTFRCMYTAGRKLVQIFA